MTRINVVPVTELTRQHLIAEYRELPRLFALIRAAYERGEDPDSFPTTYRLGPGHVRFFYNKVGWLITRFYKLVAEMKRRGYKPNFERPPYEGVLGPELPFSWFQRYEPLEVDLAQNRWRIAERLGVENKA